MTKEPLRINIDASALAHSACIRWFYNLVVGGKGGIVRPINDIEFGSAYHIFRETLAKTRNPMAACSAGTSYFAKRIEEGMLVKEKKEWMTTDFLLAVFMKYLDKFGIEKSYGQYEYLLHPKTGEPMVEQTFDNPFYKDANVDIHLQGTMDEFVRYPSKLVCIGDDKSSSAWNQQAHLLEFRNKVQPIFYHFNVHLMAKRPGGEWFADLVKDRIGFRINGVYLGNGDIDKVEFRQSQPYFYSDAVLTALSNKLWKLCYQLSDIVRGGDSFPPEPEGMFNDTCKGSYNQPCPFSAACYNSANYENIVEGFESKPYEPLLFRK